MINSFSSFYACTLKFLKNILLRKISDYVYVNFQSLIVHTTAIRHITVNTQQ